jgi:hypothetical protein
MYTVKVRKFDCRAVGNDVAQPIVVATVGMLERRETAMAYARIWECQGSVAAVWVETGECLN